jgi:hypothetical protein
MKNPGFVRGGKRDRFGSKGYRQRDMTGTIANRELRPNRGLGGLEGKRGGMQ